MTGRSVDGVTVEVPGLSQLRRDLRRMGEDLGDLKEASSQASSLVAREASHRAPRRTGRLAGSGRGSRSTNRATVTFGGARLPYAGVIHYGWPAHHIAPQPFVVEAAEDTQPQWLAFYAAGVDKAVDRLDGRTY